MKRTTFSIPKMGCAAEERLVRVALEGQPGIVRLDADLSERQLRVIHERTLEEIAALVSGRSRAASLHYRPMSPVPSQGSGMTCCSPLSACWPNASASGIPQSRSTGIRHATVWRMPCPELQSRQTD